MRHNPSIKKLHQLNTSILTSEILEFEVTSTSNVFFNKSIWRVPLWLQSLLTPVSDGFLWIYQGLRHGIFLHLNKNLVQSYPPYLQQSQFLGALNFFLIILRNLLGCSAITILGFAQLRTTVSTESFQDKTSNAVTWTLTVGSPVHLSAVPQQNPVAFQTVKHQSHTKMCVHKICFQSPAIKIRTWNYKGT